MSSSPCPVNVNGSSINDTNYDTIKETPSDTHYESLQKNPVADASYAVLIVDRSS